MMKKGGYSMELINLEDYMGDNEFTYNKYLLK